MVVQLPEDRDAERPHYVRKSGGKLFLIASPITALRAFLGSCNPRSYKTFRQLPQMLIASVFRLIDLNRDVSAVEHASPPQTWLIFLLRLRYSKWMILLSVHSLPTQP